MVIDCHVHVCAMSAGHGRMSERLMKTMPFRFMRWRLGMVGSDEQTERQMERTLVETIDGTPELDAAVVLAFDGVYRDDGIFDDQNTHLYVTNDYVIELCRRHPKMLFGASINPLRPDAIKELERCIAAGAVLLKWLPIVQGFNPADPRCIPFYEALAHYKLPLLAHTGGEKSLIRMNDEYADPRLLEPALQRGVTVIAAHCGTKSAPFEQDFVGEFVKLVHRYENLYGDTAALNLPPRMHAYRAIFNDPLVRSRIIHGSDWPIIAFPPPFRTGLWSSLKLMRERNWMRRDVLIKQRLGFDRDYWERAARVLRVSSATHHQTAEAAGAPHQRTP
jgi:predicted TIM-barrel fold metal-dependent hydrolase